MPSSRMRSWLRDASIGTDQLGKYLYIVNDSNVVRYRPIEVGQLVDDTLRQVTAGISPKDSYVTSALLKVRGWHDYQTYKIRRSYGKVLY